MTTTPDFASHASPGERPLEPSSSSEVGASSLDVAEEEFAAVPTAPLPSLRPALVVIACVLVVSLGGFALALFGGSPNPGGQPVVGLGRPVPGVAIRSLPASVAIGRITTGGQPPANIVDSLVVPSGITVTGTHDRDKGAGQYDRAVLMTVQASTQDLVSFYKTELKRGHWSLLGNYPLSSGGTELLAQRAGTDGFNWEVGLIMTSVSPSVSPALAGGDQTAPTTTIQLRLFQVDDGD